MYNAFINNRGQSDGESPKSRGSRRNRRIREDNIPDLDLDVEDPVADASGDFAGEPAVGVDRALHGFPGFARQDADGILDSDEGPLTYDPIEFEDGCVSLPHPDVFNSYPPEVQRKIMEWTDRDIPRAATTNPVVRMPSCVPTSPVRRRRWPSPSPSSSYPSSALPSRGFTRRAPCSSSRFWPWRSSSSSSASSVATSVDVAMGRNPSTQRCSFLRPGFRSPVQGLLSHAHLAGLTVFRRARRPHDEWLTMSPMGKLNTAFTARFDTLSIVDSFNLSRG